VRSSFPFHPLRFVIVDSTPCLHGRNLQLSRYYLHECSKNRDQWSNNRCVFLSFFYSTCVKVVAEVMEKKEREKVKKLLGVMKSKSMYQLLYNCTVTTDRIGVCQASDTNPNRAGGPRPCPPSPLPATSENVLRRRGAGAAAVPLPSSLRHHADADAIGNTRPIATPASGDAACIIALRTTLPPSGFQHSSRQAGGISAARTDEGWGADVLGDGGRRSIRGQRTPNEYGTLREGAHGSPRLLGGAHGASRLGGGGRCARPGGKERSGAAERVATGHQDSESSREAPKLAAIGWHRQRP
jgi:hypothetical protein